MERIRTIRLLVTGVALTLWLSPLSAAAEETTAQTWDQAAATEIAVGLAKAADELQQAFRRELADMMPTMDRRSRYQTKQSLRRLRGETRHLAAELKDGRNHDETIDIFLNIQEIAHDAAESGKRSMLTHPTLERIAVVREYLTQIAPYYGETWKPLMKPQ